jgi:hypothetical protein
MGHHRPIGLSDKTISIPVAILEFDHTADVEIACDLQFAEHRKRPVGKAGRRAAQILAASVR